MSWLFSQALVEEYSAGTSLDGEPCAQLNVMPTPHKFWRQDKTIEASDLSRFGLTLRLLTDAHGTALLMSYLAASRARTSVRPAKVRESGGGEADYGPKWHGLFARYDPHTSSWKTVQSSLVADLEQFSETWPKWGLMRNGACSAVEMSEPPTSETVSGFWHPTPTTRDWKGASNGQKLDYSRWTTWLHHAVSHELYTTYPNPSCSEAVMGWPIGWTELAPLETGRFQQWRQQHGGF